MRLVIFDIDGTLTQTMEADAKCFVRSLAEVSGFRDVDTDWSRYRHATDSGISQEIYEVRTGRSPSRVEVSQFRQHFVGLLAQASSETPFASVEGASLLLARLAGSTDYRIALAAGAWRDSARLKLTSAGLCCDDYPVASSDDAFDRESIIRLSIQRAAERYGRPHRTMYVGDGVWDARARRRIGIPFIGVAADARAPKFDTQAFDTNASTTSKIKMEKPTARGPSPGRKAHHELRSRLNRKPKRPPPLPVKKKAADASRTTNSRT